MTPKPPAPPNASLDDPDAPASEQEVVQSAALRRALEDPKLSNEAADLARALSLANAPRPLAPAEHRRIVQTAVAARPTTRGGLVIRISFGAAALAAAAAATLVLVPQRSEEPALAVSTNAPLIRSRSTQPLFDEPFGGRSSGSSHIDRIAMARASDFRENEFSRWGAR